MPGFHRAGVLAGTGPIVARHRASFSPADLERAVANLEAEGYRVTTESFLLERGVLLAAWNPQTEDGYLVAAEEVGPVARLGIAALDPYGQPSDKPRWQRPGTPDSLRMTRYAEAVLARCCAEMQAAPEGARNQTLNRVAFVVGQFLDWNLDEGEVLEELTTAAMSAGLSESEARQTAGRALARGRENPRPPLDPRPANTSLDSWSPTHGS